MNYFSTTKTADVFQPTIQFKKRLKKVIISGVSRMPDPGSYYEALYDEFTRYYNKFNRTLLIEFYFDYINTGTSKWLYYILKNLEYLKKNQGGIIEITWNYEKDDESIEETGEVFKSQIDLPIVMKAV